VQVGHPGREGAKGRGDGVELDLLDGVIGGSSARRSMNEVIGAKETEVKRLYESVDATEGCVSPPNALLSGRARESD
jgi:hypothetical protein